MTTSEAWSILQRKVKYQDDTASPIVLERDDATAIMALLRGDTLAVSEPRQAMTRDEALTIGREAIIHCTLPAVSLWQSAADVVTNAVYDAMLGYHGTVPVSEAGRSAQSASAKEKLPKLESAAIEQKKERFKDSLLNHLHSGWPFTSIPLVLLKQLDDLLQSVTVSAQRQMQENKDDGARLIHPIASPLVETLPRLTYAQLSEQMGNLVSHDNTPLEHQALNEVRELLDTLAQPQPSISGPDPRGGDSGDQGPACDSFEFDTTRGTHKLRKFDFCKRCGHEKYKHHAPTSDDGPPFFIERDGPYRAALVKIAHYILPVFGENVRVETAEALRNIAKDALGRGQNNGR